MAQRRQLLRVYRGEQRGGTETKRPEGMDRAMHDPMQLLLVMWAAEAERSVELQLYETVRLWLVMLVFHLPVYFFLGWALFRNWESFWEAIVFWIKPDFWSWLDDEYWDDIWAEAKLALWFWAPIGPIGLEMWLLGW